MTTTRLAILFVYLELRPGMADQFFEQFDGLRVLGLEATKIWVPIDGMNVPFISLEMLIKNKLSERPQQNEWHSASVAAGNHPSTSLQPSLERFSGPNAG